MPGKQRYLMFCVLSAMLVTILVITRSPLALGPIRRAGPTSSYNWSGYAVTASAGAVSDVKGSWTVPAISGTCPTTNQYSSFWVGIDGYSSNTVEQTGTDSDCRNGTPTYYAWYEFYPKPSFIINSLTIHPGDAISSEVSYSGGKFTLTITDVTTQQSFSKSAKVNAQRSSAEWIAEAPSSSGGVLPLANFGTVYFTSGYATIGGTSGSIGSFGSNVQSITMVSYSGAPKATPSSLSSGGTDFSVAWNSSGP